ncbi:MAG: transcriptional regulator KorA [Gammaproteobacteria bacterium]|nr:transcriptional regulator KorA [Gammaproteobacteria bacterium]
MALKRNLTAKQFEKTIKHFPNMSQEIIDASRRCLVDKERPIDVVRQTGVIRESLIRANKHLYDRYLLEYGQHPEDWVSDTVCLPPDLMTEVIELEKNELAKVKYAELKD